jgi:hypothetical protein
MFYQTESKAQNWRAIAKFADGREALLLLGRSSSQIRNGYLDSFKDLLDAEEKEQIVSISMQRWNGAPDLGVWEHTTSLKVPVEANKLAKMAA